MRKGFGCGAVGDTRVDLARSVGVGAHGALHTATKPHFAG